MSGIHSGLVIKLEGYFFRTLKKPLPFVARENIQGDHGGRAPGLGLLRFVEFPGWRAVTTAICCLTGGWNIPNLSQPNPGARPSWSPCILDSCCILT